MAAIIQVDNLTKKYGNKTVVDHISFSIEENEIFGMLGPNGAGKTTTIKMLNTLATISEGKASVAGCDVGKNPGAVRASIGVVPQELTADDELKGIENLILSAKLHHVPGDAARKKSDELLKLVDLENSAERRVKTFSGGMRRRLQLAMGLIHSPKIVFLDEPSLGLDIQTRRNMWDYIRRLNKESGLTVFMTTHYLEEADALCGRVAIIDGGLIKVMGSPSELKSKVGGDVLTMEVGEGPDLTSFIGGLEGVQQVTRNGQKYQVKLPKAEKALPGIVQGVVQNGVTINEISFSKPSLEQVFLEVTGRSMSDAEESGDVLGQRVMIERMK